DSATLTIDGLTVTVEYDETGGNALTDLLTKFEKAFDERGLGIFFQTDDDDDGVFVSAHAPMVITVEVAGVLLAVSEVDLSESNKNSGLSTVLLGAGDDTVSVNTGAIVYGDSYDLGDGNNSLTVEGDEGGSVYGNVTFGTGNGSLSVGEDIGGRAA